MGNLLDFAEQGIFDIIVHGCNCQNRMNSGIAKEIRARYPQAWEADCRVVCSPIEKLGTYSYEYAWKGNHNFMIVNAYTQLTYNAKDQPFFDRFEYDSFGVILRKLEEKHGSRRFGFPYIGMGLAGGDKDRIITMLDNFAGRVESKGGSVTLVEFG